jgi:hypothetical protein
MTVAEAVDPRTVFPKAVHAQGKVKTTETRTNEATIRVSIKALLDAARGVPPTDGALFVVDTIHHGRPFVCEQSGGAN